MRGPTIDGQGSVRLEPDASEGINEGIEKKVAFIEKLPSERGAMAVEGCERHPRGASADQMAIAGRRWMPFGQRAPKGYHGYDRRRAVRWEANHPGALILADGKTMNCVIRDFSSRGARLEVLSTFGLCEELVLKFSGHRQWVKVAWTGRYQMGVQFI